jgi:hypothetical protein
MQRKGTRDKGQGTRNKRHKTQVTELVNDSVLPRLPLTEGICAVKKNRLTEIRILIMTAVGIIDFSVCLK